MGLPDRYEQMAREFLGEAGRLLGEAESNPKLLPQVSEKYWGAVAEAVKAVAALEGRELRHHRDILEYADELARRHPELGVRTGFSVAQAFHANFYESYMSYEVAKQNAVDVESLAKALLRLLHSQ